MSKHGSKKDQQKYAKRLAKIDAEHDLNSNSRLHHDRSRNPIGNKLPNLKKQRHWATTLRAGSLIFVFGIILLIMDYLVSPISKVDQITIVGNKQVDRQGILTATKIKKGNFMWQTLVHGKQINRDATAANPEIKKVQVKMAGPQKVKLTVNENKIVGYLKRNNYYYPILASGHVKKNKLKQPQSGQPVYDGFKSTKILEKTVNQYSQLSETVQLGISEIKFQPTNNDEQRLRVFMNDGNEILIKYSKLAKKMPYYPSIAQTMSANGVVNLELGAYSYSYGTKDH